MVAQLFGSESGAVARDVKIDARNVLRWRWRKLKSRACPPMIHCLAALMCLRRKERCRRSLANSLRAEGAWEGTGIQLPERDQTGWSNVHYDPPPLLGYRQVVYLVSLSITSLVHLDHFPPTL